MTPEELKEFEETCKNLNLREEIALGLDEIVLVKNFINNLLKSRQEKIIEAMEKSKLPRPPHSLLSNYEDIFNHGLDKAMSLIKNN